ncbi:MAG: TetR/AcrR family transcriptional regulator [Ilumatobacter sp.]
MTDNDAARSGRIGRPPKVDQHGTPTRDRLLQAAVAACIEFGYEGVTLSDIARRAEVSTPAVYSHFSGKDALLVAASKRELYSITDTHLTDSLGLKGVAEVFLHPDFAQTRILLSELHNAAHRSPELAEFLAAWQTENGRRLSEKAGLSPAQVHLFYLLLLGATHVDTVTGLASGQDELVAEMGNLIDNWRRPR